MTMSLMPILKKSTTINNLVTNVAHFSMISMEKVKVWSILGFDFFHMSMLQLPLCERFGSEKK